jgi:hypothetical protein
MQDLARYRAMESLCRQVAAFRPLENWRLLAEAEMWHHRALQEISLHQPAHEGAPSGIADRIVAAPPPSREEAATSRAGLLAPVALQASG